MKSRILVVLAVTVSGYFEVSAQAQLKSIESVEYDSLNNRYLISNSTNIIAQSATDGSLSVFGQGAASQYGMEILKDVLYAVMGQAGVKGYDLTTGSEVASAPIASSQMLNGITTDGDSLLWVTDTFGKSITQINVKNKQSPQVRKIVASTPGQPNGIFHEKGKNRLVFVNWGNNAPISAVDLGDNKVTTVKATDRGNCDGITRDRAGNWYISCWLPQPGVFKLAPDFSGSPVSMPGTFSGPADMDYNPVADVVAVPNTSSKTVTLIPLNNPVAIQPRSTVDKMKSQGVLKWTAGGTVIFDANDRKGMGGYNVRGRSVPMVPRSAD